MTIIKTLAQTVGCLRALPGLVCYKIGSVFIGQPKAFIAASERIGRIPGYLGIYARQAFYRCTLEHVGKDVYLGMLSFFSKNQARVGNRVYIGRFCTLGWVDIGDDVLLADGVQVLSGQHQHGSDTQAQVSSNQTLRHLPQTFKKITLGRGAWLGAGCIIMADVGEGAIVGAGAVVTRPVPAHGKVAGIPAKPIEQITTQKKAYT